MANPTKKALGKAYDAGQAARRDHLSEDVCPFAEGPERDAWLEGRNAELAEKWLPGGGRALAMDVTEGA